MIQYGFMICAGFITGVMSGVFGIGGGVILIPILVLVLRFNPHTASGTSLVALLLPVGILGVIQYFKAGSISYDHIRYGLLIALGLFVGTYFGSKFAMLLPDFWLRKGFALLLMILAVRMWITPAV
ncbi:sulfite exporter TauE/SafE family protein [Bdellovibrionota bacterium FG-1]